MGLITSKLGISLIVLLIIGGAGYYIKHLLETRAVMERVVQEREVALDSMANAFTDYALNSEAVIDAYNINNTLLQKDYERSRKIVAKSIERTNKHDYQELLNARPAIFIKHANRATSRLFRDFEEISGNTQDESDRDNAKAPESRPDDTTTP